MSEDRAERPYERVDEEAVDPELLLGYRCLENRLLVAPAIVRRTNLGLAQETIELLLAQASCQIIRRLEYRTALFDCCLSLDCARQGWLPLNLAITCSVLLPQLHAQRVIETLVPIFLFLDRRTV